MLRVSAILVLATALSCTATPPSGVFICIVDPDCPDKQLCVDGLCRRGNPGNDAGRGGDRPQSPTSGEGASGVAGPTESAAAPASGGNNAGSSDIRLPAAGLSGGGGSGAGAVSVDACAASMPSKASDGCCPPGANATNDADCRPKCGNGTVEMGERCDPKETCPTVATCTSTNPCLEPKVSGDPKACTSECDLVPITSCKSGDRCCPMGCNYGSDMDCSQTCRDGVISGDETCEPTSTTKPCPTLADCDNGNACTSDSVTGSIDQCSAECAHKPITNAIDGDSCCPDGATIALDADCSAKCGDGVVTLGTETCDPKSNTPCPTPASCQSSGCMGATFSGDPTKCTSKCDRQQITALKSGDTCCPDGATNATDSDCPTVCGNGLKEGSEACDPKATGEIVGYTCDTSCKRLNRLTACTDGASGQCLGSPPSTCDSGFCRPLCPNLTAGSLCDAIPGATKNESTCNGEPKACAWLCTTDEEDAYCGPSLWCDGTFCRVKP
jgi:hypothetical protein